MKNKIISLSTICVLMMSALVFAIPVSAKPADITVDFNQAQFQWRGITTIGGPFGDWTSTYQNYATSTDFTLTGNVLHTAWDYSPTVSDQRGESTVYVYNKKLDLWIEKEGHVSYIYTPYYGDYVAVNYFRGYLKFDGAPSTASFVHGVAYQWVCIFAPEHEDVTSVVPDAIWDTSINAWLVGFSIYLWDSGTQTYDTTAPYTDPIFPSPFVEPMPANNYNPLDL